MPRPRAAIVGGECITGGVAKCKTQLKKLRPTLDFNDQFRFERVFNVAKYNDKVFKGGPCRMH